MKVTECLNTEHGVFLTQLEVLEQMLKEGAGDDELRAVMLAIARAVEKHRDMEEATLYPYMLRVFGENFPPIRVMEAEHQQIEQAIEQVRARDGKMSELVSGFITVLRQHIAKEMDVLFPMAEQRIEPKELEQLACQCTAHAHSAASATSTGE